MSNLALAIATKGAWDPDRLLRKLREVGADSSIEIHVACAPEHMPASPHQDLSVHSQANATLFDLWGLAISQSQSVWVAVLHADALPAAGWFESMTEAIGRSSLDGYMGPVEPGFAPSDSRIIGYLTEYVQFHRPWDPRLKEIPGSNLVLPRTRLERTSDFSKTRLFRQGLSPQLVESAVVLYARPFRLGEYCARRFRHGRSYAADRTPPLSLIAAIPLVLALPLIRTLRVLRHAWRHKEVRGAAVCWLPAILLAESFWSAGELAGYVLCTPSDASRLD